MDRVAATAKLGPTRDATLRRLFCSELLIRAVIVEGRRKVPSAIFQARVRADLFQELDVGRCHHTR